MRLRVLGRTNVLADMKLAKGRRDREKLLGVVADFERRRADWELNQISLAFGEIRVSGMLKGIERVKQNGEDVVIFRFWEV